MTGELKKLQIEAYASEDREQGGEPIATFSVQFNPASFTRAFEIEFEQENGSGNSTGSAQFKRFKPQDYTIDFIVDGTGATGGDRLDVTETVDAFLAVTYEMDGDLHRPRYLRLVWGDMALRCVLKSASVNFTLFRPDGKPLRAKVTAVFSESLDEKLRVAKEDRQSPDLTRYREVIEGETLPLLAWRHLGDENLYARVARFNDLHDFRALHAGAPLKYPPLDQLPELETDDG